MATSARLYHQSMTHFIWKRVNYSDSGMTGGTLEFDDRLPANACIIRTFVDVETAFAATTTNVLTVGTVSGTANDIVTGGDVNETTAVPQLVTGVGVLSSSAEKQVFVKFTGAGTANTAGDALIVIEYAPLNNG